MSFLEVLDTLLLKPLQLLFEVIYVMADKVIGNPGLSIIVLSLFMNFLVLPLYIRADKIQEEEHELERKLQRGVEHIKKTFSGDERMMLLQTYYKQNNYKPVYVMRSATSLLLQIPFFIAAYRFLSGLQLLNGVSFGPIPDLGMPDGMLPVGGMSVNILPIIMTAVNLVSCIIFTKGSPLKAKIQLYVMALFFLVFLYTSPAGLVFYWTLNNIFSLVKTIVCKLKINIKTFQNTGSETGNGKMQKAFAGKGSRKLFLAGGLFLSVLTGALIPSAVIKSSPLEFTDITYFFDPRWFVVSSFCMAIGIFVIWSGVFYFLAKPSIRVYFDIVIWFLSGVAIVNYMFFGKDLGLLTSELNYENALHFTGMVQVQNFLLILLVLLAFNIVYRKRKRLISEILAAGILALSCMTIVNMVEISEAVNSVRGQRGFDETPRFRLSRSGNNVIVIMLDRAMGEYIPFFFQEKPELEEQFSGFTYYPNTISFGAHTNFASPALFGGYEYTPVEINKRSSESLGAKQDEALKVMPVLFAGNGYDVTVCDPPYAGYQWIPNLSIYQEYPEIQSYITNGKFTDVSIKEQGIENRKRNFFCYGILKVMPLCIQGVIYDQGNYNKADSRAEMAYSAQVRDGTLKSEGMNESFMNSYNVLASLPYITDIVNENTDTYLMLSNETTHEAMLLQEPEYVPKQSVDNTIYENGRQERGSADGRVLKLETDHQVIQYQANMAALLQLGKWFDDMRENNVYDNTRIILVSDHGYDLYNWEEFKLDDQEGGEDISIYYPLLMVKDFGSSEFVISEEFMTNADVPAIAVKDIIDKPVNPFTGKIIDSGEKTAHDQYVITSHEWDIEENNGNMFSPADWYSVHSDMRDRDNWKLVGEDVVLPAELLKSEGEK